MDRRRPKRADRAVGPGMGRHKGLSVPEGAEEADAASLVRTVRCQIGNDAEWVKVYADNS
jgi:hypothetical protein